MWCRFDDDILCWSDVIVMITAGHIRVPTHGKPKLTLLLSPDNTHHISPEIIFKSPLAPVPTFSQSPSDASQILTGNLQTQIGQGPQLPPGGSIYHLFSEAMLRSTGNELVIYASHLNISSSLK